MIKRETCKHLIPGLFSRKFNKFNYTGLTLLYSFYHNDIRFIQSILVRKRNDFGINTRRCYGRLLHNVSK